MKLLLVLAMLRACVAAPQDLSGKMFTFPQETDSAYVRLNTQRRDFSAVTVCHRSFTDLMREHSLFSLAVPLIDNGFLIFWDEAQREIEGHIKNQRVEFWGFDYKPNRWHSLCTTWDSSSGMAQLWFDGKPSSKKIANSAALRDQPLIILGQEQDAYGSRFDQKQSFVGMMSDVHMWDYVLSPCEIQKYVDELKFTPGNVLNWEALDFDITGRIVIEDKQTTCH